MTNANETFEEEYEDYDAFDEEDEERGLSGFVVLIMGLVMLGAFCSVVWIAYQQGIKTGQNGGAGETPFVAADPEPIKIETADAGDTQTADREVYDAFDGDAGAPVAVLAEGPEEPVSRQSDDPIASIASVTEAPDEALNAEVEDRIASLAEEDAANLDDEPQTLTLNTAADTSSNTAATQPTPVSIPAPRLQSPALPTSGPALSGSHVVQVGAFRSDDEAMAQWSRLQSRLGDYLNGKSQDVERADLGDRGVYHRLRIGPFRSSDDAQSYCAGLKERGQDCLVKSI